MKTFNGTKSFWINESGKRQYCNAVVSFISGSLMQVKLFQHNQFEYDGLLSTHDHLHYSGRIHISGNECSVSCKCFMMPPRMLLFGEWKKGGTVHEFCVHANVKERINSVHSMIPPAA